jgi:type 1 glutamine amidotransferase
VLSRMLLGLRWWQAVTAVGALVGMHLGTLRSAELVPVTAEQKAQILAALPTAAEATKPKQSRRVLLCSRTEGFVHSCIPVANFALEELGPATGAYSAELTTDMTAFTTENLARFDAVLFNNTTRLAFADPAHRSALIQFIEERGGGLIGIHAASDNFYDFAAACAALGGHFDGHPWTSKGTWAVKLDEPSHPANAPFDGRGFWINDEIYQIGGPYSRDSHRVLLSLDMSRPANLEVKGIKRTDGDFPISWFKHAGTGRVFYCSLGHNEHIYWNPAVLRHYLAGIQYALGDRDLPDAPSAALTHKPQPALAPETP